MRALFATPLIFHLAFSTECHDYFECESQVITDSANCYGFGSCYSTSISTENCYCDGAHSCHAASIDADESIFCRSVNACESCTLKSASELFCEGVSSCADANIEAVDKAYLYGHYGAVHSVITGASTVRGYGYYSLLYATITSDDIDAMSVQLHGVEAGYKANIICTSGSKCTLLCKADGCLAVDFLCFDGSSCSVLPIQCLSGDDTVQEYNGISCPQWKISTSTTDDAKFMEYMKVKEKEKGVNVKWQVYKSYTRADTQSFASLIAEEHRDKGLDANIMLFVHGTNVYSYVVAAVIAFVLIGVICSIKKCNDRIEQYQKI